MVADDTCALDEYTKIPRCQFCNKKASYTIRRLSDDKCVPACWICKALAKWATLVWEVVDA